MAKIAPGGGAAVEGSVPWPRLNLVALWEAGRQLGVQARRVAGAAGDLAGARGKVPTWSGRAADQWHADLKSSVGGLDDVSERLGAAARILSHLYETIQHLQSDYQAAVNQEVAARHAFATAHPAALLRATEHGPLGQALAAKFHVRAQQEAVDQVREQARIAANRLIGLISGLPKQHHDSGAGHTPAGPSMPWVGVLLGTIAQNRAKGDRLPEGIGAGARGR